MNRTRLLIIIFLLTLVSGQCVFGSGLSAANSIEVNPPEPSAQRFDLLFIGNSHSSANGLPDLVSSLIEAGLPAAAVQTENAAGFRFLDERLNDGVTQQLLNSRSWTHVILQAQKYSSSGQYFYSTQAAEEWIRRVKSRSEMPILFPEWPRRGNREEGPRIHQLHLDIASREPACVAPIGLAWEASITLYPDLDLHAPDGNHSNLTGALLTAYVLYEVITSRSAANLPHFAGIAVAADIQKNLRDLSSQVIDENEARCTRSGIAPSAQSIDFGISSNEVESSKQLRLVSSGILPASIQSISEPGPPFGLLDGDCLALPVTLAPGESCSLVIGFSPQNDGVFDALIEIDVGAEAATTIIDLSGFSGPVVPALNRWGLVTMALLLAASGLLFRGSLD